jgi:hypothetical protein
MSPATPVPSKSSERMCAGDCGEPLSVKRLEANPAATFCVPCLEKAGDVPTIKRYDEVTPDGDVVSTVFTANKRIERQMRRTNSTIASEEDFAIALGDDSHLTRESSGDNDEHSYHMSEAFESVEEEETALIAECAKILAVETPLAVAATA